MKYLIVNGDDFGASHGINRGIMEAHERGILTSTSLLVNTPWSKQAVEMSRAAPELSVGLHLDLRTELRERTPDSPRKLYKELQMQLASFEELMGRPPTHLDSHHNVHRDSQALPQFLALAVQHGLPLREHSPVRYFSKFYGQWNGQTHLEQISPDNLLRMLETEIQGGVTELSCHPGYIDPNYSTGYGTEREVELRTLCDPTIRAALIELSIQLVNYRHLHQLTAA